MNYFEELRATQKENLERKRLVSDLTYFCFNKFVFETLPGLIKAAKDDGNFYIEFSIRQEKGTFTLCGSVLPKEIDIDDLLDYFRAIPGLRMKEPEYNCFSFRGDLEDLGYYYFFQLQADEHYTKEKEETQEKGIRGLIKRLFHKA